MVTYSFYIPRPDEEISIIMIALRDKGKRSTISSGLRIETKEWDKKAQCVVKSAPDFAFISEKLAEYKSIILKEIRIGELDNLSLTEIRDRILASMGRTTVSVKPTDDLISVYRTWATTSINQHNATRQHLQCFRLLVEYSKYCDKTTISFEEVNYIFYTEFLKYMRENKGYKVNTIATHIKNLKAVMNEAAKRKLHTNMEFKNFTKTQEEVDNVYLTNKELDSIYQFPLSGMKAKVRDLFLIGCYTGMRFGDYSKLTIHDVAGEFIKHQQEKTGTFVTIPIHFRVKEIITKYHGAPKITQQKLNEYIKVICHDAGIRDKIAVTENGITRYEEKCELVSSHTARRTAATNMFLSGIPAIAIMKITGHKTESSFMKYIKITNEENARNLASAEFFSANDKNREIIEFVKATLESGRNPKWLQLLREALG